jgi:hypothetical protein
MAGKPASAPAPLLKDGQPVEWWFGFKFNAGSFPGCGGAQRACLFWRHGSNIQRGIRPTVRLCRQRRPHTRTGGGCPGDTTTDPVGTTFNQVYKGNLRPRGKLNKIISWTFDPSAQERDKISRQAAKPQRSRKGRGIKRDNRSQRDRESTGETDSGYSVSSPYQLWGPACWSRSMNWSWHPDWNTAGPGRANKRLS